MRMLSFTRSEDPRDCKLGALLDDQQLLDLRPLAVARDIQSHHWFANMLTWLEAGVAARDLAAELLEDARRDEFAAEFLLPLADVRLCAPLVRPRSLRDCLSFERHWIQCAQTVVSWKLPPLAWLDRAVLKSAGRSMLRPPKVWRQRPIYYKGNPASVVGHETTVRWPSYSGRLDFELEIAVYIGTPGRDIPVAEAMEHVAGYSLLNDFSARDVQFEEMRGRLGPAKSKDFDTGNVLGPYLVTQDEVDLQQLSASVVVNGETWAETSAQSLQHSVAETVSFLSQDETLHAGDVIGLGTLPNGCGLELDRWIQPGDTVELRCPMLGTLRNRVERPA